MSEPGPARQVVVLREGPPKRRGIAIDIAVGILGILLLALAVALVDILPEEEDPGKQFQFLYPQNTLNLTVLKDGEGGLSYVERDAVAEGTVTEYVVPVERANMFEFRITFGAAFQQDGVFVSDDVPSSLPDRFRVELVSPNGTLVGELEAVTPDPYYVQGNTSEAQLPYYMAEPFSVTQPFRIGSKPADEFVSLNSSKATKADALRAKPPQIFDSRGDWIIRVTVVQAGDCPDPAVSLESIRRASVCQQATENSGEDTGNPYAIQKVVGFYYDVVVRDPDEADGGP